MRALATATLALSIALLAPAQGAAADTPGPSHAKQRDQRALSSKRANRVDGRSGGRNRKRRAPKRSLSPGAPTLEPGAAQAPQPTPTPASAPGPASAPPAPTTVPTPASADEPSPAAEGTLFRSDFESAFAEWYVQSLPGRATLLSGGTFQGSGAARFEVRDGDVEPDTGSERSEVSGPTFDEGQDLYIRDAIRVPSSNTYSAPWQIIQQLHETSWGGSPGIAVFLDDSRSLKLGAGDSSPMYWQGPALQADRWYDLVYRVYLSQDVSEGFVEVWLDGVQQTLRNGSTRMHGQTIQTEHTYIKAGIYRSKSSTGTSVVEHDQIVVGTSLAAVTAD